MKIVIILAFVFASIAEMFSKKNKNRSLAVVTAVLFLIAAAVSAAVMLKVESPVLDLLKGLEEGI